jgi:uncharacterized membrane protein (UPF0182 family)
MKNKENSKFLNFHPSSKQEKEETFNEIANDFKEVMENEDNFFQIQQIQEKTQVLEEKKKSFREIKHKFIKEIEQLQKLEQDIDIKYEKAVFEKRLLGGHGVPDSLDEVDIDEVIV